jgi:hypothetical protein
MREETRSCLSGPNPEKALSAQEGWGDAGSHVSRTASIFSIYEIYLLFICSILSQALCFLEGAGTLTLKIYLDKKIFRNIIN